MGWLGWWNFGWPGRRCCTTVAVGTGAAPAAAAAAAAVAAWPGSGGVGAAIASAVAVSVGAVVGAWMVGNIWLTGVRCKVGLAAGRGWCQCRPRCCQASCLGCLSFAKLGLQECFLCSGRDVTAGVDENIHGPVEVDECASWLLPSLFVELAWEVSFSWRELVAVGDS